MVDPARPTSTIGRDAERRARRYLEQCGLELVTSNFRCPGSEIDLIMRDGRQIVFVEVRFRSHPHFGGGAESVDRRKRDKLTGCALYYLQRYPEAARHGVRFDVIAMGPDPQTIDWIKDAFQAG